MSMFNDIEQERKDNEDSCALVPQGRSKKMPQILTMDIGHSWALEKKASGIKDMQHEFGGKWDLRVSQNRWKILRIQDIRYSKE